MRRGRVRLGWSSVEGRDNDNEVRYWAGRGILRGNSGEQWRALGAACFFFSMTETGVFAMKRDGVCGSECECECLCLCLIATSIFACKLGGAGATHPQSQIAVSSFRAYLDLPELHYFWPTWAWFLRCGSGAGKGAAVLPYSNADGWRWDFRTVGMEQKRQWRLLGGRRWSIGMGSEIS